MLVGLLKGDDSFCEARHHARQSRFVGDVGGNVYLLGYDGRSEERYENQDVCVAHRKAIIDGAVSGTP
jgi:hypothetical protein